MATVVLNAYSKGYPFITNRLRASVYLQSDPQALIATIIDTTAGHPQRIYSFPGLPRNNYGFNLDEIDGSGNVVNNLAKFDVVPGQIQGYLTRDDEQIQVDFTPGFVSGTNSFVFDGTSGKPDYTGWKIVPSELTGRGILVEGLDYSWDSATGTFTLLQGGDKFQTGNYYNIHFDPIVNPIANSYPTLRDFEIEFINNTTVLDASFFGKKLIIEPGPAYIEVTLPPIATVVSGRPLMVEVAGSLTPFCVKFIPDSSDIINWLNGHIYCMTQESFWIYKRVVSPGLFEWRLSEVCGNFKTVGQSVAEDAITGLINKHLLDGSSVDRFQFGRIYNEYILNLPVTQVVNYDVWNTGNNKYFYSLANSADPGNLDKFHFPDRRGLFERNNNTGKAGDWFTDQIKEITIPIYSGGGGGNVGVDKNLNSGGPYKIPQTLGKTETFPAHYLINKYVLL